MLRYVRFTGTPALHRMDLIRSGQEHGVLPASQHAHAQQRGRALEAWQGPMLRYVRCVLVQECPQAGADQGLQLVRRLCHAQRLVDAGSTSLHRVGW